MPDLDDRIRSLVASAVADAPPAQEIDVQHVPAARRPVNWAKRGSLALAALLAAGGGGLVLSSADEGSVDTKGGTDTSTTLVAPPPPSPSVIVTAGPNGVREIVAGTERVVTNEPMAFALPLDNGDVIAQRRARVYLAPWPDADTVPLLITTDGKVNPLFDAKTLRGQVQVQDFSVVGGRRILLYSVFEPDPGPSGAVPGWDELLYALDLDTNAATELGLIGGWEHTHSRLHLGNNGLIIATEQGIAGNGLRAMAVPGSPAASRPLPTQRDFGFDAADDEDCECPTFVLDAEGSTVYWVDGGSVMSVRIGGSSTAPRKVATLPDYGDTFVGRALLDISDEGIVVSYADSEEGPSHGPVLVEGDTVKNLDGQVATVGPNG